MNDRLAELQRDVPSWAQEDDGTFDGTAGDIEMGQAKMTQKTAKVVQDPGNNKANSNSGNDESSQPEHMKQFFDDVEAIKSDIAVMSEATKQIITLRDRAVLATSETEEAEISESIQNIVGVTHSKAKKCKNLLGLLKEENAKLKKEEIAKLKDGQTALPPFLRVRDNLVNTLLHKFIDEMKRYQNAQQQYKTDLKKKVTHQIQMIKPDATDEEVDQIMRSEGGREALFQQQIILSPNEQIRTQYRSVAGKYQDVLTLEASVAELHQMFLDFALLTEQQGELLDQIEYQMGSAADYVEDANVHVYEAIEISKKIRKKQCWILLIVVVLIIILLFVFNILP